VSRTARWQSQADSPSVQCPAPQWQPRGTAHGLDSRGRTIMGGNRGSWPRRWVGVTGISSPADIHARHPCPIATCRFGARKHSFGLSPDGRLIIVTPCAESIVLRRRLGKIMSRHSTLLGTQWTRKLCSVTPRLPLRIPLLSVSLVVQVPDSESE